ncbi:MAG: rhomboid family intramembrane serine protease [Bacteroidaceae bacterium]|nr:rhomboid family intramembrane serine protease [Bacteroidaceae bacterium]
MDYNSERLPSVTKNLLIINFLAWMGTMAMRKYGIDWHQSFGLHFFLAPAFRIWQLFTYMFLHEGFAHLFFNMFAVWMFGRVMERTWGSRRFLIFYILCGLGAGACQELCQYVHYNMVLSPYTEVNVEGTVISMSQYLDYIITVGASGAVYGVLLSYGMAYPNDRLIILPIPIPIRAKWVITGYVALELMLGLRNSAADNVAHFAHLGGMLTGLIIILYWRMLTKIKKKKDNHINFTW